MKSLNFYRALLLTAVFWCCCLVNTTAQIYQNTFSHPTSHDHYSVEQAYTPGHNVMAGTLFGSAGGADIQLQQVDDAGAIVWDVVLLSSNDERAFHIEQDPHSPLGLPGYVLTGIADSGGGANTGLVAQVDQSGNLLAEACFSEPGWLHTNALHISAVEFGPDPGYLVTGFVCQGYDATDPKAGWVAFLNPDLSINWSQLLESAPNYAPDWDMLSNGIEIPGSGLFLSGSSNGFVTQDALAVKLEYDGSFVWSESYHYDSTPNAEYNIASSAVYEPGTDRIYQLVNLSEIHCFAISCYDGSDPFLNRLPQDMTFINGTYINTAGYSIDLAPNGQSLTVSGLMRDGFFQELEPDGTGVLQTYQGTFAFMLNVDFDATIINWQELYPIQSPGYASSTGFFQGFSAGQQPRVLHPEMSTPKNDGNGYVLNAYNFLNFGDPQDLEGIETDNAGNNPCVQGPLGITFHIESWLVEQVVNIAPSQLQIQPCGLSQAPSTASVSTCNTSGPCIPDPAFIVTQLNDCCYQFDVINPGPAGVACDEWELTDGAGNVLASGVGGPSFSWCFAPGTTGLHTICYTACCVDADGTVNKLTTCEIIDVNCDGQPCTPDPTFQIVQLDGCCFELFALNSDPTLGCDYWEILDAAGLPLPITVPVDPAGWIYCFPPGTFGTYSICYTACCVNPDGTISTLTMCQEVQVDCPPEPCDVNADFLVTQLDDCCWRFEDLTPDPVSAGCQRWDIFDAGGAPVLVGAPGTILDYCFPPGSVGVYQVCYTDCCINADGTVTTAQSCQLIDVNCPDDPCIPDPSFDIVQLDGCCIELFTFNSDPDLGCDYWEIFDPLGNLIPIAVPIDPAGWLYCFPPGSFGTYTICYTACCVNPDGTISTLTTCEEVQIDCPQEPCEVNADFLATPLDECCWRFEDLTPDPASIGCERWDIFDASGAPLVTGAPGQIFDYCFPPGSVGVYQVCFTDCCINPDGTITTAQACILIDVNCPDDPCVPDPTFVIDQTDDCCYAFAAINGDGVDLGCELWEIYDAGGLLVASAPGQFWNYCFPAGSVGVYTVCYTACCINPDGTINSLTQCQQIDVNCPGCIPDPTFVIDPIGDCCYAFAALNADGIDLGCEKWEIIDPITGAVIASSGGEFWTYCFPAGTVGSFIVCYTDCCINPDGTVVTDTFCQDLYVDCCELPAADELELVVVNSGTDCRQIGACVNNLDGTGLSANYCIDWTWGDGTSQTNSAAFCPFHDYVCDGTYTVCATIYCCDDPTQTITLCRDVVIDCPCTQADLPADANFGIDVIPGECKALVSLITGTTTCPEEICYDFFSPDPGVTLTVDPVTGLPCFEFPGTGTYTLCLHVACCDDPTLGYDVCYTIDVQCPCELPDPDLLGLTLVNDATDCDNVGACVNFPAGTDLSGLCIDWFWGDGTSQSEIAAFCPIHDYECNGTYTVCAEVYCCNDPLNRVTICGEVTIECPCTIDSLPQVDMALAIVPGECKAIATVVSPAVPCPDEVCYSWYALDPAVDQTVDAAGGVCFNFPGSGTYTICLRVSCCDNPDIFYDVCQSITVDCPCELPTSGWFLDIINFDDPCEEIGACIVPPAGYDPLDYCVDWDFGDGNTASGSAGDCPVHTYATSGVYIVCATIYCCDNPDVTITICDQVVIECCQLPSSAGFDVAIDECTVTPFLFYTDDYTGPLCFSWDFGDGTVSNLENPGPHTYSASGTYTICVTIYCCNDPSLTDAIVICQEVTVDCPCEQPCQVHAAWNHVSAPFTYEFGCCMDFFNNSFVGPYTTVTSYDWDFGDGGTSTLENPSHCFANAGVYIVCLTVKGTSPDGDCEDTYCFEVHCDCFDTCPGDTNHDGTISVGDILVILGVFGTDCP